MTHINNNMTTMTLVDHNNQDDGNESSSRVMKATALMRMTRVTKEKIILVRHKEWEKILHFTPSKQTQKRFHSTEKIKKLC